MPYQIPIAVQRGIGNEPGIAGAKDPRQNKET